MATLTPELASAWFTYDPSTGVLTWKQSPGRRIPVGTPITGTNNAGYIVAILRGRIYPAHRIAWVITHGECPPGQVIDHMNRVRCDNRLSNLRASSFRTNSRNSKRTRAGALPGAYQTAAHRWKSSILVQKQYVLLGTFASAEEAHARYNAACALVDQFISPAQFKELVKEACAKDSIA